jgi:hypothetical protein
MGRIYSRIGRPDSFLEFNYLFNVCYPPYRYMRVCDFAGEGLRSERAVHDSFPSKELQDYWSTHPKFEPEEDTEALKAEAAKREADARYNEWLTSQNPNPGEGGEAPPPYSLEAEEGAPSQAASSSINTEAQTTALASNLQQVSLDARERPLSQASLTPRLPESTVPHTAMPPVSSPSLSPRPGNQRHDPSPSTSPHPHSPMYPTPPPSAPSHLSSFNQGSSSTYPGMATSSASLSPAPQPSASEPHSSPYAPNTLSLPQPTIQESYGQNTVPGHLPSGGSLHTTSASLPGSPSFSSYPGMINPDNNSNGPSRNPALSNVSSYPGMIPTPPALPASPRPPVQQTQSPRPVPPPPPPHPTSLRPRLSARPSTAGGRLGSPSSNQPSHFPPQPTGTTSQWPPSEWQSTNAGTSSPVPPINLPYERYHPAPQQQSLPFPSSPGAGSGGFVFPVAEAPVGGGGGGSSYASGPSGFVGFPSAETSDYYPGYVPPGGSSHVPQGGSSYTPPGGSNYVPPGGSSYAPQGGSSHAPQGGSSYTPQGGSSYAPQGGSKYTPQGGSSYAPHGGSSYAPHGGSNYAPQGGSSYTPQDPAPYAGSSHLGMSTHPRRASSARPITPQSPPITSNNSSSTSGLNKNFL